MKETLVAVIICYAFLASAVPGQRPVPSMAEIDKRYAEFAAKARLVESDEEQGQFGDLFVNKLSINDRRHQWRAVGVYEKTYSFFYRAVDDEKRLYPDQLIYVKVLRRVSDREYREEFLFGDSSELLFYRQTAENDSQSPRERKVHFERGKATRFLDDGSEKPARRSAAAAAEIARNAAELASLFTRSLKL